MKLKPCALLLALMAGTVTVSALAETYPVVGAETQQGRDDQRRAILGNELATEKKSLEQINVELADAIKAQKTPDEVRAIAAKALGHSNNIESLQRELDGLAAKPAASRKAPFVPQRAEAAPAPSNPAPADVPYWDVYKRKQSTPPATKDIDQDEGDGLNDSPTAGDKEADSGSTK
ncbi:hypothetical protein CC202_09535 [Pseudomonas savastanoi]|uniref:hypothetical protein n=1 Tax=Pseudomonas savastanoi TaxID=29438 RepID=UPI000BA42A1B|nr:hypothetical protein [Pseudomonas savastanoi]PAB33119.1 hypothetical protein CC202_09535 [Pseudomonas savastanoi]